MNWTGSMGGTGASTHHGLRLCERPFINAVQARHKHVLVKVKTKMLIVKGLTPSSPDEPSIVLRDATFDAGRTRCEWVNGSHGIGIKCGFGTVVSAWSQVREPLRLLRIEEVRQASQVRGTTRRLRLTTRPRCRAILPSGPCGHHAPTLGY